MAHEHSSSQPVRRSTRQKSSKKDTDFLYSELPGHVQWQDFKFPDEEFLQSVITKQGAAEAEKSSPSAHRASSATADHIRPSNWKSASLRPKTKSWRLNSKFCDFAELMAAQTRIPRIPARNLPPKRHARKEQWTGRMNSPQVTFPLLITIN